MASYTDSRVKLTNEVLQGVRAIKSYNWERVFKDSLASTRRKELDILAKSANVRAILVSVLSAAPSFVAVVTLAVYAYLGKSTFVTIIYALAISIFPVLVVKITRK
jgi:ATP-binding cassette subfamily C (CFTR/MRP) protein 3